MPSVAVNSSNIGTFSWSASINIYEREAVFTIPAIIPNTLGVAFSMVDSVGLELMGVNWSAPQIISASATSYTLDLTSLPVNFLFQNYRFIGYIKDADGAVYQTAPVLKNVCIPSNINDDGYVPGSFQIIPDCTNNVLTVKEFTVLIYNNQSPLSVSKTGTLYYPTGTLASVAFTGTPFSNSRIYTGSYRITCTTVATYDLLDNIFVLVSYYTDSPFPVVCSNFLGDITCCTTEVLNTYKRNCDNAIGQNALQKYNSVTPYILNGVLKQMNGQDTSLEVAEIKKVLNCDCGASSVRQNEATPIDPTIYSIVLTGVGGTTVPSPTITGSTKTYQIASKSYIIAKGDIADLAYTITTDISVTNVVTYKITFNYDVMAGYILTAIEDSPSLVNQLNSLISSASGSITGLDGKCVINLTTANYSVSQSVTGSTLVSSITINGVIHNAPASLFANNSLILTSWLNSLSLGSFTAVIVSGTLTIQSINNVNNISTVSFTSPSITKQFSSTNASLVQVLQAIINYLCNLSSLQVALGANLTLCSFDYNGAVISSTYTSDKKQSDYNAGIASAICVIVNRINTLTGVTCATIKALFSDRPASQFVGDTARIYGIDQDGNCTAFTPLQIGAGVMSSVNAYSAVKDMFCAIDCTVPGNCPDISGINASVVSGNIGIYGVNFATAAVASQTLTVKYRVNGTSTWSVATSSLGVFANGNVSGSSPYTITGLSTGTTYDVQILNNCGGNGAIIQITTPTGSVYSASYYLDNIIYNICGASPVTLYSSSPFASGVTMYSNVGLTTPVTGYTYITANGSNIFAINTSTGVVGADTGSACSNGVSGSYSLGNSTATICAVSPVTLYTNGAFAIGKVLYTDAALTNPQLGYSYVVSGGVIYSVNSSTGAVTGSTGLSCVNYTLSASYNFSISSVTGTGIPALPPTGLNGSQSGHHTAMSGSYTVVLSGTVVTTTRLDVLKNGVSIGCQAVSGSGSYIFTISATEADDIRITINSGACS